MPSKLEEMAAEAENQTEISLDLPEGVPPLNTLYLYVSGACNLACRHCWITPTFLPDSNGGQHVKLEHVQKAIKEGKPLGLSSIKLTGGEPTIHPQFRDLVVLIAEAGVSIQMETNGTLIDDSLAKFLKEADRVGFISVSLDGADAETHDDLRAVPGSHGQAIAGLEALVRAGYQPQIICTLHQGNVSQIAEVVSLAKDLGCKSVKFNIIQEMGRGEQFSGQHGLQIPELVDLHHYVQNELVPKNEVDIFFDIPFAFRPLPQLLKGSLGRCGIRTILGMLAGGELALCGIGTSIPELVYGHIERDDLREVWCFSPGLVELRESVPAQLDGI